MGGMEEIRRFEQLIRTRWTRIPITKRHELGAFSHRWTASAVNCLVLNHDCQGCSLFQAHNETYEFNSYDGECFMPAAVQVLMDRGTECKAILIEEAMAQFQRVQKV